MSKLFWILISIMISKVLMICKRVISINLGKLKYLIFLKMMLKELNRKFKIWISIRFQIKSTIHWKECAVNFLKNRTYWITIVTHKHFNRIKTLNIYKKLTATPSKIISNWENDISILYLYIYIKNIFVIFGDISDSKDQHDSYKFIF